MGGRLLPLSPAAKMKGGGIGKVGRCFCIIWREVGRVNEENYGGGQINPLPSKVEKLIRLHPPKQKWRRAPSHRGETNPPTRRKEFGGVKPALGGKRKTDRSRLLGEFSLEGELKCPLAPANPGGGRERGAQGEAQPPPRWSGGWWEAGRE